MTRYWLMKSEPTTFGIDNLKAEKVSPWDGVRNYQARNFMRDDMKMGDQVLIYHSACEEIGVVGLGEVVSKPYPDPSAFNRQSKYFDPKSKVESPTWILVDIQFKEKFKKIVSLSTIKADPKLVGIVVAQTGSRLSIQPVSKPHYTHIVALAHGD